MYSFPAKNLEIAKNLEMGTYIVLFMQQVFVVACMPPMYS